MTPLDSLASTLTTFDSWALKFLDSQELHEHRRLGRDEVEASLRRLFEAPISEFTVVNKVYFRAKWASLFHTLAGTGPIRLLEVATGDEDMIPQAMARSNPGSTYTTANMNRLANASLLRKTSGLPLNLNLIEGDARELAQHVAAGTLDVVAFQHGVNDVLQAILCEQEGMDTSAGDWFNLLPSMIRMVQDTLGNGTFDGRTRPPFLALLATLLDLLKADGLIAIHHYMFQYDLDLGYPRHLWENLTPIIRDWTRELSGITEVQVEGFDPQWWLLLRKSGSNG